MSSSASGGGGAALLVRLPDDPVEEDGRLLPGEVREEDWAELALAVRARMEPSFTLRCCPILMPRACTRGV